MGDPRGGPRVGRSTGRVVADMRCRIGSGERTAEPATRAPRPPPRRTPRPLNEPGSLACRMPLLCTAFVSPPHRAPTAPVGRVLCVRILETGRSAMGSLRGRRRPVPIPRCVTGRRTQAAQPGLDDGLNRGGSRAVFLARVRRHGRVGYGPPVPCPPVGAGGSRWGQLGTTRAGHCRACRPRPTVAGGDFPPRTRCGGDGRGRFDDVASGNGGGGGATSPRAPFPPSWARGDRATATATVRWALPPHLRRRSSERL